jgi:HSP20 family protein
MSMVKRSNLFPSRSLYDDFLMKDLFDWSGWASEGASVPRANIVETNDEFRVEIAAPGMKKDDFHVEFENDILTIHSEFQHEMEENENQQYLRKEYNYQSFKRSFYLPKTVEAEKIKANYKDGILSLIIPKKEEAKKKPPRQISIS